MAPPGFGKTTALAAWARAGTQPTAWLSLSRHDRGPESFAAGLVTALHRTAERHGLPVRGRFIAPNGRQALITHLERVASGLPGPVVVIVDDAHLAEADDLVEVIRPMAESASGSIRFVLAGTGKLDTWFNRQLVGGAATLVTSQDLALTTVEIVEATSDFDAPASAEVAASVHRETGGWPVAVRLALLNLDDRAATNPALPANISDDLLTGYVTDTVLNHLPPELAEFVLATTTCDRIDADLATALSGHRHSAPLLEECVRRGLFLDRYVGADGSTAYRWHDVFAQRCRVALQRLDAASAARLDLVAADWLAPRFPIEATVHAMRAGAPGRAVDIIREHWLRLVIESHASALNARCLALPTNLADTPEILLIRACCVDVLGDSAGSALLLARARSTGPAHPAVAAHLESTRALADLFLAHRPADLEAAADRVRAALDIGGTAHHSHAHAVFLLGWTELRLRRDTPAAVRFLAAARNEARAAGHRVLAHRAASNLAFALAFGGEFLQAELTLDQAPPAAADGDTEWFQYDGGIELVTRGFIHYWHDELAAAQATFRTLSMPAGEHTAYTSLARIFYALTVAAAHDAGALDEAAHLLTEVVDAEVHGVPWQTFRTATAAALAAAGGDIELACKRLDSLDFSRSLPMVTVLAAEMYRRAGRLDDAARCLKRIVGLPTSYVKVSGLVTAAQIGWSQGAHQRAHRQLERALDIAEPQRIIRPFGRMDAPFRTLLTEHAAWGTRHEQLLATLLARAESAADRQPLGSSLTRREREILGFLYTRMTAAEIAAELFVSVNTVRTHQRSIYRKLGVTNRREAVQLRP
ncbi:LuxR C-terminal-related transcriptional regulator [Rhodococcus sp. ABRD24]|uniref:LuxR C-terminal-related transcriptional regulator n=1 Tax=Rhodococcus sp. ABRD24 TaxID=2507582 RepID=UPI0013F1686D|nr:LuxR C-terminal-related transcriptional regulator [Rhodococcus sp. ABRD24]